MGVSSSVASAPDLAPPGNSAEASGSRPAAVRRQHPFRAKTEQCPCDLSVPELFNSSDILGRPSTSFGANIVY